MDSEHLVVAIDGPSGSGKSSVSRAVAAALGVGYLDTGAMYRALTWWCLERGRRPRRPERRGRRRRATSRWRSAPTPTHPRCGSADATYRGDPQTRVSDGRLGGRDQPRRPRRSCSSCSATLIAEIADADRRGAWPRAATSPRSSRPTPTCGSCSRPARRPGCARRSMELHGGTTRTAVEATRDQIVRRDRDDSTVSQFIEAADGVVTRRHLRPRLRRERRGRARRGPRSTLRPETNGGSAHPHRQAYRSRLHRDRRRDQPHGTDPTTADVSELEPRRRHGARAARRPGGLRPQRRGPRPPRGLGEDGLDAGRRGPAARRRRRRPPERRQVHPGQPHPRPPRGRRRGRARRHPRPRRLRRRVDRPPVHARRHRRLGDRRDRHPPARRRAGRDRGRPGRRRALRRRRHGRRHRRPTRPSSSCCAGPASRSSSSPTRSTTSAPRPTPPRCGTSGSASRGRSRPCTAGGAATCSTPSSTCCRRVSAVGGAYAARRPAPGRAARPAQRRQVLPAQQAGRRRSGSSSTTSPAPPATRSTS